MNRHFYKKRYEKHQLAHENMLNNISEQRNVNENCNEITPTLTQIVITKRRKITSVGGILKWHSHFQAFPQIVKHS